MDSTGCTGDNLQMGSSAEEDGGPRISRRAATANGSQVRVSLGDIISKQLKLDCEESGAGWWLL